MDEFGREAFRIYQARVLEPRAWEELSVVERDAWAEVYAFYAPCYDTAAAVEECICEKRVYEERLGAQPIPYVLTEKGKGEA